MLQKRKSFKCEEQDMNKKRKLVISPDIPPPDPSGHRHLAAASSPHDFAPPVIHHPHDFGLPVLHPQDFRTRSQDFALPVIHPQDFKLEGGAVMDPEEEEEAAASTTAMLPVRPQRRCAVEGSDTESEEEDEEEETMQQKKKTTPSQIARSSAATSKVADADAESAGNEAVRLPPIKDLMKSSSGGNYEDENQTKNCAKFQNGGFMLDYRNHPYGAAAAAAAAFHPYGVIVDSYTRVSMAAAAAAGSGFHPVITGPLYAQRRNGLFPGHISHSVPGLGYHPSALALNPRANYDYKEDIITNNFKRKHDSVDSTLSNKRGKKHDSTPVEEYVNWAIKLNNYNMTGIAYRPNKFIILNEDKFYEWVRSIKAPEYALSKSSLLEKFDKSRRTNRVNPKENFGRIPIKFLRIDKVSRNAPSLTNLQEIEKDLEEIQRQYGANHIRVITHRDWGYIDPEHFFYEVPNKKS